MWMRVKVKKERLNLQIVKIKIKFLRCRLSIAHLQDLTQ